MVKKKNIYKNNNYYFQMNKCSYEYYKERAKYICNNKHCLSLRNMIGKENGWSYQKTDKNRFTKEFEIMIINYLKGTL